MNKAIAKNLFLLLGVLALGLSIWWLVMHFQRPNLKEIKIRRDIHQEILWQKEDGEGLKPLETEQEFEVKEGENVYFNWDRGEKVKELIERGTISIYKEKELIAEYFLTQDFFIKKAELAAGVYRLVEKLELRPEAYEDVNDKKQEKEGGGFFIAAEAYEFVVWIF